MRVENESTRGKEPTGNLNKPEYARGGRDRVVVIYTIYVYIHVVYAAGRANFEIALPAGCYESPLAVKNRAGFGGPKVPLLGTLT